MKGTRATKPVTLQIWGQEVKLSVRPLLAFEEAGALAGGRSYAVSKGVSDPKAKDRLYEIGVMAYTIAVGCADADAADQPFFDGGAEQVLSELDTDTIAYLYEQQQLWQDFCCPRKTTVNADEYIQYVFACAGAAEGDDPLAMLRPVTRASFTRTLAIQHLTLLNLRSPSGSRESTDTKNASGDTAPPEV